MEHKKISLVIPAYNEADSIQECIRTAQENSQGRFHEIIVVNNASTDRTAELAAEMGVKVVNEMRKGTGNARQSGFEAATGDFIAFIDADTKLPKDWLDKIDAFFAQHPDYVCLSGPYRYFGGKRANDIALNSVWYVTAPITYRIAGFMIVGGNFVAKREALQAIGGFDRSIAFYGDDTDTARRLSKVGKVAFRMNFYIYSSSRRFTAEGFVKTNVVYALNFIWPALFGRPFTKRNQDVRVPAKK